MLRGELSSECVPFVGIDYRLLIESSHSYGWFELFLPRLLCEFGFSSHMRDLFFLKPGAMRLLSSVFRDGRMQPLVFSIGVPLIQYGIELALSDHVSRIEHFSCLEEFSDWVRFYDELAIAYSEDHALLDLDGSLLTIRSEFRRCHGLGKGAVIESPLGELH
jgi:hypothetical protein